MKLYSVGTLYRGKFSFKNFASSGTLVFTEQQMYLPEEDSFSARKTWAWQTSSTCAMETEPDSICISFKPLTKNSSPAKMEGYIVHSMLTMKAGKYCCKIFCKLCLGPVINDIAS